MKYSELLDENVFIGNIPMMVDGKRLPKQTAANVILLRVELQKKATALTEDMQEVLKGLKKEGFDDRAKAVQEMESVDERVKKCEAWKEGDEGEKPEMPTAEELKKAEETRAKKADFDAELKEVEEAYTEAYSKKLKEEVSVKGTLNRNDLAEIYEVIGTDGEMDFRRNDGKTVKISKADFLTILAQWVE